jgi:sialate O-acetylesterase
MDDVAYQLGSITFSLSAVSAPRSRASLALPGVFSDHMVLQRDQAVPVWGTAEAGSKITVEFAGQKKSVVADSFNHWKILLDPIPASSNPRNLQISSFEFQVSFSDVLVGEVWLCSGQSNMQMPLGGWLPNCPIDNSEAEIASANHPQIRLFDVPRVPSLTPMENSGACWSVCTPETVRSFSACAYYFGRKLQQDLNVPVGLLLAAWGGTRIEPWTPPCGFETVAELQDLYQKSQNLTELSKSPTGVPLDPSVLYNGMIHAQVPFAIRGAIWYQGEANHADGMLYVDKTRALVNGWRKLWGYDFPFYFVQIAPYQYGDDSLPLFWEAQSEITDAIPNTGMAVITDCSTVNNIHPPDKKTPGTRLALLAEAKTYGLDVVCSGPVFHSIEVREADASRRQRPEGERQSLKKQGESLVVHFSSADGLTTRDGKAPDGFEIAGKDGVFKPATAEIRGADIILNSLEVSEPQRVRFAWSKLAEPNLVNGAGLPASAFRAGLVVSH